MRQYVDRTWKRWFAWYPVLCGVTNGIRGTAWLEYVEYREIGEDPYERPKIDYDYTYRFLNDPEDAKLRHRNSP